MDIKLILLVISFVSSSFALQCKDEDGNDVDWYIVYKLPRESNLKMQATLTGRTGFNYVYMTSNDSDGLWKISSKTVQDKDSIWGQTLAPAYKKGSKYTYVMWNDAPPHGEGKESGTKAHSKGVIVMDKTSGFYIVHSVPKFVNPFSESYDYPDSGRDNGQSSMCISFDTQTEGPKLAAHLVLMRLNIYGSNLVKGIPKRTSDWKDLINPAYRAPKDAELNIETDITTLGGLSIRAFSKSPKDLVEIYGDIVAPALESELFVETWRRGAGGVLESDCTLDHTVNNVIDLEIDFDEESTTGPWNFNTDHSKWAISSDDADFAYVCIGDVNRMASQAKRGGGTLCFHEHNVYEAFRSTIQSIEGCTRTSNGEATATAIKEGTPI